MAKILRNRNIYPSKIMLVGEYGVILGGSALICYAGSALYFRDESRIERVDFVPGQLPSGYRFFLLDSGHKFDTGTLEKHFL